LLRINCFYEPFPTIGGSVVRRAAVRFCVQVLCVIRSHQALQTTVKPHSFRLNGTEGKLWDIREFWISRVNVSLSGWDSLITSDTSIVTCIWDISILKYQSLTVNSDCSVLCQMFIIQKLESHKPCRPCPTPVRVTGEFSLSDSHVTGDFCTIKPQPALTTNDLNTRCTCLVLYLSWYKWKIMQQI
jgi:hypothetical protein